MHELSLMHNLISAAESELKASRWEGKIRVVRATLLVGRLSGALPAALSFAFEALTSGTALEGAELVIKDSPLIVRCDRCGEKYAPDDFPFLCPACESKLFTVEQGEELYLESLDIEDG